jgi:NAD(P)H-hydrate epimerase
MYLVTASEMQTMDGQTIESFGIPGRVLMESAGRGATRFFLDQMSVRAGSRRTVGVMAGRGNNGGDGFVMARYLAQKGIAVKVYLLAEAGQLSGDAAANHALLGQMGITVSEIPNPDRLANVRGTFDQVHCWIDAILGTGIKSEVKGYYARVIDMLNQLQQPVFAVDVPSGLNADTGEVLGACIRADATATFGFSKIGHWIHPGAGLTGRLGIVDIGIPGQVIESVAPKQSLLTTASVRASLPVRPADAHKGISGHLMVIAGSTGKTGAAAMTALAAARVGAGLVTLGVAGSLNPIAESQLLEAMTLPLPETRPGVLGPDAATDILSTLSDKSCLAIGPGLGMDAATGKMVLQLIGQSALPVVLDADGLNHLAGHLDVLKKCQAPVILTPHPGEMARLSGMSVSAIQKDRIGSARDFAVKHEVHLVLKGARTVIAHPDGLVCVNPTGNPGMATGGMGDILTGAIAGLLSQGLDPESASRCGVYLHGAAADRLAAASGPVGYLAGDLLEALPGTIGSIQQGRPETEDGFTQIL